MADDKLSVRELAEQGTLAAHYEPASEDRRRRLRVEAYGPPHLIVFPQLTRRVEMRRGHRDCMVSICRLRPDCLDRFHDDMDAVLDDVFRNARVPIRNLEGWVSQRLVKATIDGYRRRHLARGRTSGDIAKDTSRALPTVNVHVGAILRKVGASTRGEAADRARREGPIPD